MTIRQGRARSFGSTAGEYARHRTGYSPVAVDWALAPVAGSHRIDVLDLAAGTGKLTAALVARPDTRVTAVEPDPAMLAELRLLLPGVDATSGTAEAIPLPTGSVDAVLVGQAWHWFDPRQALPEVARVLRPGGVLSGLWNSEDTDVDWITGFREANGWAQRAGDTGRVGADRNRFPEHPSFAATEHNTFRHSVPSSIDGILSWISTHSWVITLDPPERERLLATVRTHLETHPQTSAGPFDLPLITTVLRAVRR